LHAARPGSNDNWAARHNVVCTITFQGAKQHELYLNQSEVDQILAQFAVRPEPEEPAEPSVEQALSVLAKLTNREFLNALNSLFQIRNSKKRPRQMAR